MKITSLKVLTNGEAAYSVMAWYERDNGQQGHVQSSEWIASPFPTVSTNSNYREKMHAAALDLAPDLAVMADVSFVEAEDSVRAFLEANPEWDGAR